MNPQDAIEAAEVAEGETAYRHQLVREIYQAGQRTGFEAGYRQANAGENAQWARITRPVVHGIPHAELEQCRWGPRRPRSPRRPAARRLPRPGRQAATPTPRRYDMEASA